jgi:hypothetical protein
MEIIVIVEVQSAGFVAVRFRLCPKDPKSEQRAHTLARAFQNHARPAYETVDPAVFRTGQELVKAARFGLCDGDRVWLRRLAMTSSPHKQPSAVLLLSAHEM